MLNIRHLRGRERTKKGKWSDWEDPGCEEELVEPSSLSDRGEQKSGG